MNCDLTFSEQLILLFYFCCSKNGNYVRLLFIDYSSAFNTIVPIKLAFKLKDLGLNSSLCDWIQDFLTGRPQVVKVGQFTSNSVTLNVGAPQGCVLSPLLYSTHTTACPLTAPPLLSNLLMILPHFQQWWDRILGWGRERLTSWCQDNCLSLNGSKIKELIVALHSSYDQWDPCGEGEQLQVPRCKHLRGPDLDYTHSNTG